jgi:hypothetical protein
MSAAGTPISWRVVAGAVVLVAAAAALSIVAYLLQQARAARKRPAAPRPRPCCGVARGVVRACHPRCTGGDGVVRCSFAVTGEFPHPDTGAPAAVQLSWDEREMGGRGSCQGGVGQEVCYDYYEDAFDADTRANATSSATYAARRCEGPRTVPPPPLLPLALVL